MKTKSDRKHARDLRRAREQYSQFPFEEYAHEFAESFLSFVHQYRHPFQRARLATFLVNIFDDLDNVFDELPELDTKAKAKAKAKATTEGGGK